MKIAYWDEESKSQQERDMTVEELNQRDSDIAAAAVPAVPSEVTIRQAELALLDADLLDDVEDLVATLPRQYQSEWRRATAVMRDNGLVEIVRQQKGMTHDQIDQLFVNAAKL